MQVTQVNNADQNEWKGNFRTKVCGMRPEQLCKNEKKKKKGASHALVPLGFFRRNYI